MPIENPPDLFYPALKQKNTNAQAIPNNIQTVLTWNSVVYDNFAHTLSTFNLNCKKSGIYLVGAYVRFNSASSTVFSLAVRKNGTALQVDRRVSSASLIPLNLYVNVPESLSVGDTIDFVVLQNTGGPLDIMVDVISPTVWMSMIAPTA